jgi:hypothetical protein
VRGGEHRMTAIEADRNAPVYAEAHVDVAARAETVWDVVSGLDRYPTWNPDIREVTIDGPVAEGIRFRWQAGPGTITSTIRRLEPPRVLAWTGTTFTIKAIHVWKLQAAGESTTLKLEESWHGLLAQMFRGSFKKTLQKAVDSGVQALKAEAERRSEA